jgi:2,3-dihydroxybiphenyl 1,2-dioxygenase
MSSPAAAATPGFKLGHLVFAARKPQAWVRFCETMLGLPPAQVNSDGSRGWQVDAASQRLIVTEGRADDLAALGLECENDDVLDRLLARLAAAGIETARANDVRRHGRCVRRLHLATDPAGNTVELYVDPEPAAAPFVSAAFPGGLATALGLGHAVLVSRDLAAMERFYVDVLGFRVTERLATSLGPISLTGTFLHCNARHHSLALFDLPLRKRIHHFMLQANRMADVGAAFERAQREVPLSLDIGQHPDPDGTFSFYGATPSGFDFEIGAGSKEIVPQEWRAQTMDGKSTWGHKPSLRLKMKMAVELLASKVAG